MGVERVTAFIDGFNLYHSICRLNDNRLKWINLWTLMDSFLLNHSQRLERVLYFSALAEWKPASVSRHHQFLAALRAVGVETVMGRFKRKDRHCKICQGNYVSHEEKETDVNIAVHMVLGASLDLYDLALLVSRDSDLVPALRSIKENWPKKGIMLISPQKQHSTELLSFSSLPRRLSPKLLEKHLLPSEVKDQHGNVVATRPTEYA